MLCRKVPDFLKMNIKICSDIYSKLLTEFFVEKLERTLIYIYMNIVYSKLRITLTVSKFFSCFN